MGIRLGFFSPPRSAKVLEDSRPPPPYKGKRGPISIQGLIFPSFLLKQFSSPRAPSGVEQGTSFPCIFFSQTMLLTNCLQGGPPFLWVSREVSG